MKRVLSAVFLFTSLTVNAEQTVAHGFNCASEILPSIGLLGKGENFPQFVVDDVTKEIVKQNKRAIISKVECTGSPDIKASVVKTDDEAKGDLIRHLSVSFPLSIEIKSGQNLTILTVKQNYMAENLDNPEQRKLTQKFEVLAQ